MILRLHSPMPPTVALHSGILLVRIFATYLRDPPADNDDLITDVYGTSAS